MITSLTERAAGVPFPPKPNYSARGKVSDFRQDLVWVLRENGLLDGITEDPVDWDEESQTFFWTWSLSGFADRGVRVSVQLSVSIDPRKPLLPQVEALRANWKALQQDYRLACTAVRAVKPSAINDH